MKITLVMVLRDEAKTVEKAISSMMPIIDEVIIGIDDKTKDSTEKICESLLTSCGIPFSIYHFTFRNNFAEIRNEVLDKVQTDWAFILDGHEYLDELALVHLKMLKQENLDSFDIFDFNIVEKNLNSKVIFQQPRLFRKFIHYDQAIHNVIMQMDRRVALPQIIIYHDQPVERLQARQQQRKSINIEHLLAKAKEGDIRSMYYVANTYFEFLMYDQAATWYEEYLKRSLFYHERYAARISLAYCYHELKRREEMRKTLLGCFEEKVALNEHLLMLGDLEMEDRMFEKAISYYRMATAIKVPQRFVVLSQEAYTWLPWYKLAIAYLATNDQEGVMQCVLKGKQLGPEREEFFELESRVQEKIKATLKMKKGKLYIVALLPAFIEPIVKEFVQDYFVRFESVFNPDNMDFADVIWCEWGDQNAIAVSNYKEGNIKKILRIHAYEIFSPYVDRIDFNAFDKIIFVAEHIKNYFMDRIKIDPAKIEVIHNGIDLAKFEIAKNKKRNNNIAYAGYLNNKKGAVLLKYLVNNFPKYNFHIAGEFQEPDVEWHFKTDKPGNLILHGWQSDMNAFFADKTYILNTSIREGCPVSVLEAMACGLEPAIYDFIGAKNLFGAVTYKDNYGLSQILTKQSVDFQANRNFIASKFNMETKIERMKRLIDDLIKEKKK